MPKLAESNHKQLLYLLRLRQTYARRDLLSMPIVNRCFEGEPDVAGLANIWKGNLTDGPVPVERRDSIEHLSRTGQLGSVARDRYPWERIEDISKMPLCNDAVLLPPPLPQSGNNDAEVESRLLPAPRIGEHKTEPLKTEPPTNSDPQPAADSA